MPINIGGKVNVNAPRDQVWESIFDVETMKGVIGRVPGITLERLEQTDEMHYELTAVVGVAAIKGKYDGKITVVEKIPPTHVKIKGEGKGGGNFTSGDVVLDLLEVENGVTEMAYKGIGNLNGPLASLGQRLVDTVGRSFIDQGAKIFAGEIESRVAPVPVQVVPVETPPYGFVFQAFVLFVVIATIVAVVVILTMQALSAVP